MKIIGITGRARSGKDTLAEFPVSDHGFVKLSFAAPIRAFVADITGLPVSAMEDGPLRRSRSTGSTGRPAPPDADRGHRVGP